MKYMYIVLDFLRGDSICLFVCVLGNLFSISERNVASILGAYLRNTYLRDPYHPSRSTRKTLNQRSQENYRSSFRGINCSR